MENTISYIHTISEKYDYDENTPDFMKIGCTFYEVTRHFNPEGKQSVLKQFMTLLLNGNQ